MRRTGRIILAGLLIFGSVAPALAAPSQAFHAWVKVLGGFDDNVNSAADSSSINLPDVPGFTRTFVSSTDSGYFLGAGAGLSWSAAVTPHWKLLAGGRVLGKHYYDVDAGNYFDSDIRSRVYFGVGGHYDKQRFGLTLLLRNRHLDGSTYDNSVGVYGRYSYALSPTLRLGTFLLYRHYDYQFDTFGGKDADMYNTDSISGGASLTKALLDNRLELKGGFYVGSNHKTDDDAPDYISGDVVGLHAKGTWHWTDYLQTSLDLWGEKISRDGDNPYFTDRTREDKRLIAALSLRYDLGAGFSISPEYTYIHNDSSIPMRDYERNIFTLELKKQLF